MRQLLEKHKSTYMYLLRQASGIGNRTHEPLNSALNTLPLSNPQLNKVPCFFLYTYFSFKIKTGRT